MRLKTIGSHGTTIIDVPKDEQIGELRKMIASTLNLGSKRYEMLVGDPPKPFEAEDAITCGSVLRENEVIRINLSTEAAQSSPPIVADGDGKLDDKGNLLSAQSPSPIIADIDGKLDDEDEDWDEDGKDYIVVIFGIDGARKTTLLNKLTNGNNYATSLFDREAFQLSDHAYMQIYNFGGQEKVRANWFPFCNISADAAMFCVIFVDECWRTAFTFLQKNQHIAGLEIENN